MKWISVWFVLISSPLLQPIDTFDRLVAVYLELCSCTLRLHPHSMYREHVSRIISANDLLPIGLKRAAFNSYFSDVAFPLNYIYRKESACKETTSTTELLRPRAFVLWKIQIQCLLLTLRLRSNCVCVYICSRASAIMLFVYPQIIACQNGKNHKTNELCRKSKVEVFTANLIT